MSYAEIIKDLCKEFGTTVTRLEKDLGFSNGYIRKLNDKIPTDRAILIAEHFGLPSDYFMPDSIKKGSTAEPQNPLIQKIMSKARTCSDAELEQILDYANYVLSKR